MEPRRAQSTGWRKELAQEEVREPLGSNTHRIVRDVLPGDEAEE